MPKIPVYDSQATLRTEKLTEEAPAIRIPAGSFSAPTQALGEMGQAIGKIGENIYTLQAQEELSKANIQAHQGRLEIENTQDAETQGWLDRRQKEIQDLRANTLKGIRNPLAKRGFEAEFDNDIIDTQFRLKKTYVGLTVDKVKTALYQERETAEQEIFSGINNGRKQARIDKIGKRYSQLARLGGMKPDVALKEFREWQVELSEGEIKYEAQINPRLAMEKLNNNQYSITSKNNPVKWAQFKESIETQIKERDAEIVKKKRIIERERLTAVNQRENENLIAYYNGTLTLKTIDDDLAQKVISPQFAISVKKALTSSKEEKPTILESIIKFNELVERNVALARKEKSWLNFGRVPFEEITKFRADVINANADGYITKEQTEKMLNETSRIFYREPIFQNALNQLAAQSKLYATGEAQARAKAEMYGNLITKVIAGKEPREAVQEVIKEKISTEIEEAVKRGEIKDKRVIDIIETLRKKNTPDSEITKFMREKGLDPELYRVKE